MAQQLEYHDAANIFPMMEEKAFAAFRADIVEHGVLEPVDVCDGRIIDGRNRYQAAMTLGVKCPTVEVKVDDPVAYVLSKNLHRRHMSPSQLSLVAARAREIYDELAKARQKASGGDRKSSGARKKSVVENLPQPIEGQKARDAAGKAVGVSGKSVDHATKVLKHGTPELVKAVDEGRIAVSKAATLATESKEKQREAVRTAGKEPRRALRKPRISSETGRFVFEPVGVFRANEAINILMSIPTDDPLRRRGFEIVEDWVRHNKHPEEA